jgi:glycosyltransferase involved in cell wall biosynthesis
MREFSPETAIVYEPDQPDGLQTALEQALSAPLTAMGSAANKYIEQFPWSLVATETLAVYQSVLAQGGEAKATQSPKTQKHM